MQHVRLAVEPMPNSIICDKLYLTVSAQVASDLLGLTSGHLRRLVWKYGDDAEDDFEHEDEMTAATVYTSGAS